MSERDPDLVALATAATLADVSFTEMAARRNDATPAQGDEVDFEPTFTLSIAVNGGLFRIGLRVDVTSIVGEVSCAVAAEYEVRDFDNDKLLQPLLVTYANEVGVMTLMPFLRQGVSDLTQRVFGTALVMPVMPRGALSFDVENGDQGVPLARGV